jgi:hypothetical protein
VAPPFEEIEPKLCELRAFVLNDLDSVVDRAATTQQQP